MKGKISEDEYLSDVFQNNNWNADKNLFKEIIRKNFHKEVDGMINLIEELSRKYKLILLSDHAEEWVKYIDGIHPFLNLFHKKYFSFQSGEIKRERRAFEILLNENNLDASDCLFIDDSPANIKAAAETGINVIRFTSPGYLQEQLKISLA
jgi:2-haloacid dehalogenase